MCPFFSYLSGQKGPGQMNVLYVGKNVWARKRGLKNLPQVMIYYAWLQSLIGKELVKTFLTRHCFNTIRIKIFLDIINHLHNKERKVNV